MAALLLVLASVVGCGGADEQHLMARRVNADDKRYRGSWVYRVRMGEQQGHSEIARMNLSVDGRRFHLVADWTAGGSARTGKREEWVSDGKYLWQMLPNRKQLNKYEPRGTELLLFWKMPHRMSPFKAAVEIGEDGLAGRRCKVLATAGRYDQGEVTLKYWIDVDTGVLLKKEHVLMAGDLLLIHESYECQQIQYDPAFGEEVFATGVPGDWVEVEKSSLDSELLGTKF